ncbi:MAG: DUF4230 domain-containing protein [Chthoniobacterales bacterium]
MEENVQRQPRGRGTAEHRNWRFSWPAAFALIALIAAAVVVLIFLRLESWPARTAHQATNEVERVARDVRDAFIQIGHLQPRITVNNRVYVEQTTPTAELAVLSRDVEVEHEMLHSWLGSTKRIKLHGTYAVRAGFDLRGDVSVTASEEAITVRLPHAIILGLDEKQIEVLAFENGYWNRISGADVQAELAMLPELARQRAAESGLIADAERSLQEQLNARIHAGEPLRVIFAQGQRKE